MSQPATLVKSPMIAMSIVGGMFFIFGFVTWLNGPLITLMKLAFTLTDGEAFLVPMAFYMSYFFLALPSFTMRTFSGALTDLFAIGQTAPAKATAVKKSPKPSETPENMLLLLC